MRERIFNYLSYECQEGACGTHVLTTRNEAVGGKGGRFPVLAGHLSVFTYSCRLFRSIGVLESDFSLSSHTV